MGMLLSLLRFIPKGDAELRRGNYSHADMIGREIWQKTLGIVGLGAIGRGVAERAKGFRMNIIGFDPYWPQEFADANDIKRCDTVEELLPQVDVLTLHCNLTDENKHMINKKSLATMKPNAVIVNTARGGLINENDLFEALQEGVVAGAAIDAWTNEPPAGSPLLSLSNVVVMPHSAAFTVESLQNMDMMVTDQILAFTRGEQPQPTVNKVEI
jgi:D-3-phosphoglycerate dehydrogenase